MEEMEKKPRGIRGGVWTEDSGLPPPPEPEGVPRKTVKKAKGGAVSSASKRADGCAQRGKTRGKMI